MAKDTSITSANQDKLDAELYACIRNYKPERVRELLAAGANPNAVNEEDIPVLHECAIWHNPEAAQILIDAGADPSGRDPEGNTALHKSTWPDVSLILMKAGVSPKTLNGDTRLPQNAITLQDNPTNSQGMVTQTITLLQNCALIERDADKHSISEATWNCLWPNHAFDGPPPNGDLPQLLTMQYFLHRMEQAGKFLPKEYLFKINNSAAEGMCRYIAADKSNISAWKRHCDAQGTSMTPQDWRISEVVNHVDASCAHLLFDREEIMKLPNLEPLHKLYDELNERIRKQPGPALEKAVTGGIRAWLDEGKGKFLNRRGVEQLYKETPDYIKPFFPLQQAISQREGAVSPGRGR